MADCCWQRGIISSGQEIYVSLHGSNENYSVFRPPRGEHTSSNISATLTQWEGGLPTVDTEHQWGRVERKPSSPGFNRRECESGHLAEQQCCINGLHSVRWADLCMVQAVSTLQVRKLGAGGMISPLVLSQVDLNVCQRSHFSLSSSTNVVVFHGHPHLARPWPNVI